MDMQSRTNRRVVVSALLIGVVLTAYVSWKSYAGYVYGKDFSGFSHRINSYVELGRKGILGLGGRLFLACTDDNIIVLLSKSKLPHDSYLRDGESDNVTIIIGGKIDILAYKIHLKSIKLIKTHYFHSLESKEIPKKILMALMVALADEDMTEISLVTMERGVDFNLERSTRTAKKLINNCYQKNN